MSVDREEPVVVGRQPGQRGADQSWQCDDTVAGQRATVVEIQCSRADGVRYGRALQLDAVLGEQLSDGVARAGTECRQRRRLGRRERQTSPGKCAAHPATRRSAAQARRAAAPTLWRAEPRTVVHQAEAESAVVVCQRGAVEAHLLTPNRDSEVGPITRDDLLERRVAELQDMVGAVALQVKPLETRLVDLAVEALLSVGVLGAEHQRRLTVLRGSFQEDRTEDGQGVEEASWHAPGASHDRCRLWRSRRRRVIVLAGLRR